jgi:Na+-transporting methylmalonyl-CoA/oxaloacetate decarboxylase gamma subunit
LNLMNLTLASTEGDLGMGLVLMVVGMAIVFLGLVLLMTAILLVKRLLTAIENAQARAAESAQASASAAKASAEAAGSAATAASSAADAAKAKSAPMVMTSSATGGSPIVDNELVAVLTAAATAVLKKPIRVRRVRFVSRQPAGSAGWVSQGRSGIMGSHRPHLRRKR